MHTRHRILLTVPLLLSLWGCASIQNNTSTQNNTNSNLDGVLTEEIGSIADYAGFWQSETPFFCIEIPEDHPNEIYCYDLNGDLIDSGTTDYSEQRALNGNALIVFTFEETGEFAAAETELADGTRYLDIDLGDKIITASFIGDTPFKDETTITTEFAQ